jgi:hypothetical protein
MANTFTKIATVTVGSGGASTIDFSSIPSTYTDLCILTSFRSNNTSGADADQTYIKFNGGSTAISYRLVRGDGYNAYSNNGTNGLFARLCNTSDQTSSVFASSNIYITNYTSSNYKPLSVDSVQETNSQGYPGAICHAGLWSSTSAITSIQFSIFNSASFVQYSTATLYGIKNS